MLSDEEKKAIEFVKSELQDEKIARNDYQSLAGLYGNLEIETVLNIIEKQSKEIEELKNGQIDFWISDKEIEERIRNKFTSKDKIKAKIEEIDKLLNEDIYVIDGHYDDRYYRYLQDKHVLQSLLEKE